MQSTVHEAIVPLPAELYLPVRFRKEFQACRYRHAPALILVHVGSLKLTAAVISLVLRATHWFDDLRKSKSYLIATMSDLQCQHQAMAIQSAVLHTGSKLFLRCLTSGQDVRVQPIPHSRYQADGEERRGLPWNWNTSLHNPTTTWPEHFSPPQLRFYCSEPVQIPLPNRTIVRRS